MKLSPTHLSWLITGVLGAAAVAYVLLWFLPQQEALRAARQQLEVERHFVATTPALTAGIRDAERKLAQAELVIAEFERDAPETTTPADLYGAINRLVRSAGVTPVAFEPRPVEQSPASLKQHRLSLSVRGAFPAVVRFLGLVEEELPASWVESASLAPAAAGGDVRGDVVLSVFVPGGKNSG